VCGRGCRCAHGRRSGLPAPASQYAGESAMAEVAVAKVMLSLLGATAPFDLEACRADVRRVVEVLQAFAGRLACLDAQVNGLPEV
jgi:hypothetical protein